MKPESANTNRRSRIDPQRWWSIFKGKHFKGKHFYRPPILFWHFFPQTQDFHWSTGSIGRRNILWKFKIQFFLYLRACPHIWNSVSRFSKKSFQSKTSTCVKIGYTQKRSILCLSPVIIVYWDRLEKFSKEYYLQCIIWNKMWCKSSQRTDS